MEKKFYKNFKAFLFTFFFLSLSSPSTAEMQLIQISGKHVDVTLPVELVATPTSRSKGLMYRESLAKGTGMLFDFHKERPVYMWMKNTEIALDMLFADADGVIFQLHEGAIPHDLTIISSHKPARWVLEVNAGFIKEMSIQVGDRIDTTHK
ncbi:DUF192 domain-containing protein [Sneathiella glossodoripedis]|uniref:DUF192 domain-containing protein n=1 Tax=Sneathiella glossodoripedis TaxID=418853 RepID=UPI00046EE605|nr:DUF192 domain-containing protein [Sneathiella glossodoripedis]